MQTIGKYHVEKVLGRGGMGTVYLALDPVLHRKVALKTMIPGLADTPELKARFLREAQAGGSLRHHNIVTVYDLGEDRGQPYIAMEFIEGTDLEKIIQNREPLSLEWKLDVLRQVCDGLGYAHRSGIVHRDVKPANIRVTPDGEVKIMDFGIAHLQSSTMTKSGLVLGTAHYMSPEQVEGVKVDHRADIFSVGAIAYELISYRRPFDGESITSVMFKIMREPADMTALPRTDYSPGLEKIVARALSKSVKERYQSLEEMRDDLERLVRDTAARLPASAAAEAPPPPPPPPTPKPALTEGERAELLAQVAQARAEGHLQKALTLARRLREAGETDAGARVAEIEQAIREKEVEQLSGMALSYAADGDLDLARKIASKVASLAPGSAKHRELEAYLEEETARREAGALLAAAQEHIAQGNLEEALAAAEKALTAQPDHALAREIRERASRVLRARDRATGSGPSDDAAAPSARPASPAAAEATLTPIPTAASDPEAARKAEARALTAAALNHFMLSDHAKARRAVERALALDPTNRKAQELLDILTTLG